MTGLVPQFLTVEAKSVWAVVSEMTQAIALSACVFLTIMRKPYNKFAKTQIGRDGSMSVYSIVTVTIENRSISRISSPAVMNNLTI